MANKIAFIGACLVAALLAQLGQVVSAPTPQGPTTGLINIGVRFYDYTLKRLLRPFCLILS
jgi:hypothetical protein